MKALSTREVSHPSLACCPFSKYRDGFVIAEGATVLVLELEEKARARGAAILAHVEGHGQTADAFHMVKPQPDGFQAIRAVHQALQCAGLRRDFPNIRYIHAHGTSTPLNDRVEARVIEEVFGEITDQVPVSSTKSMTGHQIGAAGAFGALVCIMSLLKDMAPQTINLIQVDEDCSMLDHIRHEPRKLNCNYFLKVYALANAFGFGGNNSSLLFSRTI
jgi:3-oxoacyl-[acyl-carrier-protein] synthase II